LLNLLRSELLAHPGECTDYGGDQKLPRPGEKGGEDSKQPLLRRHRRGGRRQSGRQTVFGDLVARAIFSVALAGVEAVTIEQGIETCLGRRQTVPGVPPSRPWYALRPAVLV